MMDKQTGETDPILCACYHQKGSCPCTCHKEDITAVSSGVMLLVTTGYTTTLVAKNHDNFCITYIYHLDFYSHNHFHDAFCCFNLCPEFLCWWMWFICAVKHAMFFCTNSIEGNRIQAHHVPFYPWYVLLQLLMGKDIVILFGCVFKYCRK